jgi:hypothetical protein
VEHIAVIRQRHRRRSDGDGHECRRTTATVLPHGSTRLKRTNRADAACDINQGRHIAQPTVNELRANMVRVDADFSVTPFNSDNHRE